MHKKLAVICFSVFLLILSSSVMNAQTSTGTSSAGRLKQQLQELQAQKQPVVPQVKKEARIELRQQIKETIQAKKDEVREAVATRKEEFKAKLQAIKDQKKKALVERIDTKLMNANIKHTDRFTHVLSNLQTILDKISGDVDKAEAQASIDSAKAAVEAQAAKTYIITISAESALRSDVGAVTSQLRQELMATYKLVIDAKQAVQALRANNVIMKKEATSSANL